MMAMCITFKRSRCTSVKGQGLMHTWKSTLLDLIDETKQLCKKKYEKQHQPTHTAPMP